MATQSTTLCPNCGGYLRKPWNLATILEHDPLNLLGSPVACTNRGQNVDNNKQSRRTTNGRHKRQLHGIPGRG